MDRATARLVRNHECKDWFFTILHPEPDEDPTKWEDIQYLACHCELNARTGDVAMTGFVQFTKARKLTGLPVVNWRTEWRPRNLDARIASYQAKKICALVGETTEIGQLSACGNFRAH